MVLAKWVGRKVMASCEPMKIRMSDHPVKPRTDCFESEKRGPLFPLRWNLRVLRQGQTVVFGLGACNSELFFELLDPLIP